MTDTDLVVEKLRAIGGVAPDVITLVHLGTPIPKARVKRNRFGRVYTPKRNADAEGDLAWALRRAINTGRDRNQFTDTVALVALFFVPTWQRKDTDNCLKLVMDAATKAGIWRDDSQVKAHAVFLELDPARPRTVVAICSYYSSMSTSPLFTSTAERTSDAAKAV